MGNTGELMLACEATGFEVVLIEPVVVAPDAADEVRAAAASGSGLKGEQP
jgi:hypothetical protein